MIPDAVPRSPPSNGFAVGLQTVRATAPHGNDLERAARILVIAAGATSRRISVVVNGPQPVRRKNDPLPREASVTTAVGTRAPRSAA